MQFKKMTLALTLLLALSTTACSVGGGGGDVLPTATSTTTTTNNSSSSSSSTITNNSGSSSSSTTADNSGSSGSSTTADNSGSSSSSTTTDNSGSSSSSMTTDNSGSSSSSTTADNSGSSGSSTTTDNSGSSSGSTTSDLAAEKAAMMKNSVSSFFNTNSSAASYKYATDEAARSKLFATVKTRNNVDTTAGKGQGSCPNNKSSGCGKDVEKGTIIASYAPNGAQSYAGYAVIRETYDATNAPSNSFVYLIGTPTTNRANVVDATYKGTASYSSKYNPSLISQSDFTLNVKGNSVNGVINKPANGKGVIVPAVTFSNGVISATGGMVTFKGDALFHKDAFNSDLNGTFNGAFAGANAEEVAGVFETNVKDNTSAQGAFAGTRQK